MSKVSDLYPLLKAYSVKLDSPYIEINAFLTFLEKYAGHKLSEDTDWEKWVSNTAVAFWRDLSGLIDNKKCIVLEDATEKQIYMPFFYIDKILDAYGDIDNTANLSFPCEESLRIDIHPSILKTVYLQSDMGQFFEEKHIESNDTNMRDIEQIVKLIFPDGYGSALLLAPMIPRKLMEASLLKIRHYLRSHENRDFALHKLNPLFPGKEKQLQEMVEGVMRRPIQCLLAIEDTSDLSYHFWTNFCSLVKNDISKKDTMLTEDIAAIQAAYIIETCNIFYKARAAKKRDRETAFRHLETNMSKFPGYYDMDQIIKFTNDKGLPLMGQYSANELETYIKKKTTECHSNELPSWLILRGPANEQWFIKKDKYLSHCIKLLVNARPVIRKAILKRWTKNLKKFQSEAAMEKDAEFEKLIKTYCASLAPELLAMLNDPKLFVVFEETERSQGFVHPSQQIFKGGKLLSMTMLFTFRRRDMLADARLLLPFWYSIPILSGIIAFFKNLASKKKDTAEDEDEEVAAEKVKDNKEIQSVAKELSAEIVPEGQSIDDCLADLEGRWNKQIIKQSRQNLTSDVQAIARDNLRHLIKFHKSKKLSKESIKNAANHIINHSSALRSLSEQTSLRHFIELYMAKLLLSGG